MIDFRYHIVSLVAVFLALAIGIVIGGFSLQGEVGASLNSQVTRLRSEKNTLRDQAAQAATARKKRDQFIKGMAPTMVDQALKGQTVSIIVLPGTDPTLVKRTKQTIGTADGTVSSTIYVSKDWIAQDFAQSKKLASMAHLLQIDTGSIPAERLPGIVLGRAATAGNPEDATSKAARVLPRLTKDKLVTVTPEQPTGATGVVILWPGMHGEDLQQQVTGWTSVIAAVGASTDGVVGVSAGPVDDDPEQPDDLVSSLRRTPDSAARMSTVDDGRLAMGQVALALALRAELNGKSGQYGVGHDATATFPKDTVS